MLAHPSLGAAAFGGREPVRSDLCRCLDGEVAVTVVECRSKKNGPAADGAVLDVLLLGASAGIRKRIDGFAAMRAGQGGQLRSIVARIFRSPHGTLRTRVSEKGRSDRPASFGPSGNV